MTGSSVTGHGSRWPWPGGAATGIGSMPGDDFAEALRTVLGELPDLPYLPELPDRGPGADLIGRSAALLVDLPVELYAARWRVTSHPGRDVRAARDLLERDLDTMLEQAGGYVGTFKVQAAGPWTLAASLELPIGGRLLHDHGATRDLAASLAEGLRLYVAEVRARLPRANVLLQLDEPSLPAVLAARIPTESGLATLRAPQPAVVRTALASVVDAVGVPVVAHCCAPDVPLELLREAGVAGVAVDLALVSDLDALGELLDAGVGLFAGAQDTRAGGAAGRSSPRIATRPPSAPEIADRIRSVWHKLGFPVAQLAAQVVVTPACGLAGLAPAAVRPILTACREAGLRLADEES
jgi:methionine synthase II (cobalamin-independent)